MGIIFLTLKVSNPAKPRRFAVVKFLIDSGAAYSVVPEETLRKIGICPTSKRSFILANGELIERKTGDAIFEYRGISGASPVIFGQKDDSVLLGVVTLEALGFALDPIKRELKALPLTLASFR